MSQHKYKTYPEYKDSRVEWLGDVPAHWSIKRIKDTANVISGFPFDSKKFNPEKGFPLIRIRDINSTKTAVFFEGYVPQDAIVNDGDVLIGMDGDFNVSLWRGGEAALNQRVACLRSSSSSLQKFLFYLLPFNMNVVNDLTYFTTVKHLSNTDILKTRYAIPSKNELKKIIDFLDHETAKIDTLIDKQQQLIKLLKEKRQAVISHAVTCGLNPDAPMKDSGVEWLGEVPAHWEIIPLKHLSKIRYGIGEPPKYKDIGVPLIRATNIRSGKISDINLVLVNAEDIPSQRIVWLKAGDIIVVRSGAGTGDSSIIPDCYAGSIAGFDMVVTPKKCESAFLAYALLSNYIRNNQFDLEKTRAAQPHLNAEELGDCFVLLPSSSEQLLICQHIAQALCKFDELIDQAMNQIELIKERRIALISAAVTGKIDVRDWQPCSKQEVGSEL